MATHESTCGGHYRPQMKTMVAQLGRSAASEQDGPAHGWHVDDFLWRDDDKICGIMFLDVF